MEDYKVPEGSPLIAATGQHPQMVGPQIMADLDTISNRSLTIGSANCCQIENKYKVYAYRPTNEYEGEIGKEFFKCKESSDCCTCLSPDCRPLRWVFIRQA